eukprot:6206840-Lingulodinium_polyedra.AAC.1
MAQPDVFTKVKAYARPGMSVADPSIWDMECILESAKTVQRQAAIQCIKDASDMPVLSSYSSDGTPLRVASALAHKSPTKAKQRRLGFLTQEILVQHQFFRSYDGAGGCHTVAISKEPVPLQWGKHGDAILACAIQDYIMARDHGHQGITVCHLAFDGALHSFLARRLRQYHLDQAIQRAPAQLEAGMDVQDLLLREWVVDTQCVAHGCHNSCKWAMHECFGKAEDSLKSLWKIFAALRSSAAILHRWIPQWLSEHVAFVPRADLPPPEEAQVLWTAVGLPSSLLASVVEDWQLVWEGRQLKIAIQETEERFDTLDSLAEAFVSILSIQGFSDSRWASVGRSC